MHYHHCRTMRRVRGRALVKMIAYDFVDNQRKCINDGYHSICNKNECELAKTVCSRRGVCQHPTYIYVWNGITWYAYAVIYSVCVYRPGIVECYQSAHKVPQINIHFSVANAYSNIQRM